jgi:mRNA interferase RelE/StbE
MSNLALDLSRRAHDFLFGLEPKQCKQVAKQIHALTRQPHPHDSKHLAGHPGFFRIDAGEFRVCYTVGPETVVVAVVGPRNDDRVYRELDRVDR